MRQGDVPGGMTPILQRPLAFHRGQNLEPPIFALGAVLPDFEIANRQNGGWGGL